MWNFHIILIESVHSHAVFLTKAEAGASQKGRKKELVYLSQIFKLTGILINSI